MKYFKSTYLHKHGAFWSVLNIHQSLHVQPSDRSFSLQEVTAAGPPVNLHAGGHCALLFPQMENFGFRFRCCRRNNVAASELSYLPSGVLCCSSLFAVTTLRCLLMKVRAMGADTCCSAASTFWTAIRQMVDVTLLALFTRRT